MLSPTLEETNMPGLQHEKQQIAQRIIANLFALEAQADIYSEEIEKFKQELSRAPTVDEFYAVVQKTIERGKEVYDILHDATKGMDNDISKIVGKRVKEDAQLTKIMNALHFNASLLDSIVATKEKLSEQALFTHLSKDKKETVEKFIHSIKGLKPITDLLESQRKIFKDQLTSANSMKEVLRLEQIITAQSKALSLIYDAMVCYPEDKETEKVLIKFLASNPHILNIMSTFDFEESLHDSILDAKAKVGPITSPRIR